MTLSMDGWSSRARLEIYTFHITSPQGDAHLYKAELLGSQTASASCIKTILEGICQQALPSEQHQLLAHKLSAICSGSASALQQAKEDLSSTYPWIITLPDAPHWLNFYAKDVAKIIPGLDNTINSLALLIRYLNSSNHATALLNEERRRLGLSHGIKSIGDTRVATVYCAAKSVLPSRLLLPPSPGKAAQKPVTKLKDSDQLFAGLVRILVKLDDAEQQRHGKRGSQSRASYIKEQLSAYILGLAPFTGPTEDSEHFCTNLRDAHASKEIAHIALKLLAIQATSMAEERSASTLGWFDAAKRASLKPANLIYSVQLCQHYIKERQSLKTAHHPGVQTSEGALLMSADPTQQSMAIERLLNPSEEGDLATLESEDQEEDTDMGESFILSKVFDMSSNLLGQAMGAAVGELEPIVEQESSLEALTEEAGEEIDYDEL
ncbi:Ribonuclease H-like domain [Ceraceosorus bombacis]|uniref:Ribonuclease H-like domain n=2 Tax=Ceraceosorus bombacis TaxID=401625 RepID=A0A0P1BA73_9BASI|nr:Ribonuclease H-like domain [Ceraceosorus bombacis]CEH12904.1 Ribonuclease H-like domain [Ceraceosorus bombacis]